MKIECWEKFNVTFNIFGVPSFSVIYFSLTMYFGCSLTAASHVVQLSLPFILLVREADGLLRVHILLLATFHYEALYG